MSDDRELVRQASDYQARSRTYRMMDLPGYMAWSSRKLAEGESEALIAHLDANSAWMLPEEVARMTDKDYDGILDDLKTHFE
jgi:hypothetical protein